MITVTQSHYDYSDTMQECCRGTLHSHSLMQQMNTISFLYHPTEMVTKYGLKQFFKLSVL